MILTDLLNLKGIRIYKYTEIENTIYLRVGICRKKIPCLHCGLIFCKTGCKYDTGVLREYQHGTINNKTVVINAKRSRYRCPGCREVFTEPLSYLNTSKGNGRTSNYDELVLQRLAFSPSISSIANEFQISGDKVRTILKNNTHKGPWISSNSSILKDGFVLGIDEKHWLKKQYHLVLTSISDKLLLALGADRKKPTLLKLLTKISMDVTPSAVCIDMWPAYRNAVKEVFGDKVPVVIDKFHVFSFVNRKILESKDILEYQRKRKGIKNYSLPSFRPLLYSKKNYNMSSRAQEKYSNLISLEPSLKYYRDIRNMIEEIYAIQNRGEAERHLHLLTKLCWESPCSHGIDIAKTLNRWFKEITNYFDYPYTNAFTEGINNKLELINRSGYGYKNRDIYLRRASLLVK